MVKGRGLTRNEKLENLIKNHSMIFMGIFEETFSVIADRMTEALAAGSAAMSEALEEGMSSGPRGPRKTDVGKAAKAEIAPEVQSQIAHLFTGIREEMASQWPKNPGVFEHYISSPSFDKGIEIVEKYDFGRPKLTEDLSDEVLASYVFLLKGGDRELAKMFKELADWQASLPKPPWAD